MVVSGIVLFYCSHLKLNSIYSNLFHIYLSIGLPHRNADHAEQIASMALEILHFCINFKIRHMPSIPLLIRCGIHTGTVHVIHTYMHYLSKNNFTNSYIKELHSLYVN